MIFFISIIERYMKKNINITKPRLITNKFCQSLGPSLNQGSPVSGMEKVSCMRVRVQN